MPPTPPPTTTRSAFISRIGFCETFLSERGEEIGQRRDGGEREERPAVHRRLQRLVEAPIV